MSTSIKEFDGMSYYQIIAYLKAHGISPPDPMFYGLVDTLAKCVTLTVIKE